MNKLAEWSLHHSVSQMAGRVGVKSDSKGRSLLPPIRRQQAVRERKPCGVQAEAGPRQACGGSTGRGTAQTCQASQFPDHPEGAPRSEPRGQTGFPGRTDRQSSGPCLPPRVSPHPPAQGAPGPWPCLERTPLTGTPGRRWGRLHQKACIVALGPRLSPVAKEARRLPVSEELSPDPRAGGHGRGSVQTRRPHLHHPSPVPGKGSRSGRLVRTRSPSPPTGSPGPPVSTIL